MTSTNTNANTRTRTHTCSSTSTTHSHHHTFGTTSTSRMVPSSTSAINKQRVDISFTSCSTAFVDIMSCVPVISVGCLSTLRTDTDNGHSTDPLSTDQNHAGRASVVLHNRITRQCTHAQVARTSKKPPTNRKPQPFLQGPVSAT